MDYQEELPNAEKLRNSDPRDYIKNEKFIKTAQLLDMSENHDWLLVKLGSGRLLSENDSGFLLAGITRIKDQTPAYGVYLVFSDRNDETGRSVHINPIDQGKAELIVDRLRDVAITLPPEVRFTAAKRFQDDAATIEKSSLAEVSELSCSVVLELLGDLEKGANFRDFVSTLKDSYKQSPNEEQIGQLASYLKLVSRKLDKESMKDLLTIVRKDSWYIWEMFGVNYPYIFSDILRLALERRGDLSEDFGSLLPRIPPQRFPVESLIKTPVGTVEDVKERLSKMPTEEPPDLRFNQRGRASAEFVSLDEVVGGGFSGNFLLEEGSRGADHIFRISQALSKDKMNVDGGGMSIHVEEYRGKYYVSNDGRHRIAALKALDMPFAPMLVSHVKEEVDYDLKSSIDGKFV